MRVENEFRKFIDAAQRPGYLQYQALADIE